MVYLIILFRAYNMLWTRRPKSSLASESLIIRHSMELHGATPTYLTELISLHVPRRALRSADQPLLEQPTHKLKLIGLRAFSVCAPKLWNSLPFEIKSSASISIFKAKLKIYLFRQAYYFLDFQLFLFFLFLGLLDFLIFPILRNFFFFTFFSV